MTPLLPTPDHYLYNLISVLLKSTLNVNVFIVEKLMIYMNLLLTTFTLSLWVEKTSRATWYPLVPTVIRTKEVITG
jgi:hypothetical protein